MSQQSLRSGHVCAATNIRYNCNSLALRRIIRAHAMQTPQAPSAVQQQPHVSPKVVVFTTPGCQYCKRAKQILKDRTIDYQVCASCDSCLKLNKHWTTAEQEVDVSMDQHLRQVLQQATGERTVPQVFVGSRLVGGSEQLAAQASDGRFDQLLSTTSEEFATLPVALHKAVQAAATAAAARAQTVPGQSENSGFRLRPELQQLAAALQHPQTGIASTGQPATSRNCVSAAVLKTFTGQDLIGWIQQHESAASRDTAVTSSRSSQQQGKPTRQMARAAAQQLLAANVVTVATRQQPAASELDVFDDALHRYILKADVPRDRDWGAALNTAYWWGPAAVRQAQQVAEELRARILALYDKHLSSDGRSVSYRALRRDPEFWDYVGATAELQRVNLASLSREQLMCLAINLYNALAIHTLVVHGPDKYKSLWRRLQFFSKAACYNIGGSYFSLDDLENGVLRGNAPGAASVGMLLHKPGLSKGPFQPGDPRAQHVVAPMDPRIHFALNCGATSCPAIKLYTPETLEEGLQTAAEAFCASTVSVDLTNKKVTLSRILDWYYTDFGTTKASRLSFLLPFLPPQQRKSLQQLLTADPAAHNIKVVYAPYDWTVNAAAE